MHEWKNEWMNGFVWLIYGYITRSVQGSTWNTLDAQQILVEWVNLTVFWDKLLWWHMFLGIGHQKITEYQADPEIPVLDLQILKIEVISKEVII